jgi:4-alpha-glucanotransferase
LNRLDALASFCGIELEYRDARGTVRRAAPETLKAVLAAMGVDASDEAAAAAALQALERADWQTPLPPVAVLSQGDALTLALHLPAATSRVWWRITPEQGGDLVGEAPVDETPLVERRQFDHVWYQHRRLRIAVDLPCGYHCLELGEAKLGEAAAGSSLGRMVLIVTPGRCWLPASLGDGRGLWGVAAQLYLLRSARDWGMGDFGDLRTLVTMLLRRGADVVGLNPLHAMFMDDPERASPYSPASRLLLNALYIDVLAVPELDRCGEARELISSPEFRAALEHCRAARLLDYTEVARSKARVLRLLFTQAEADKDDSLRWRDFQQFRSKGGDDLERGCLFLALREHFAASHADWHRWPAAYQDPASPAVVEFARAFAVDITFQAWLQFVADAQLAMAAATARPMAVGLYRDLAVGADPSGGETWENQSAVVDRAAVGAPPDIYNPAGQNWGLPPFHPRALRAEAYRSFIALLRANMRHAGGLRIDHVMSLQQLYWIPHGLAPSAGAYVRYPLEDLLGILALESERHRCLVVGEDLGTVPPGFRERMAAANVLSYRVLSFERTPSGFVAPEDYPRLAVAVAGSHDLPTLRSWWNGRDLELKRSLQLFPTEADRAQAVQERERDHADLLRAFRDAGLIDGLTTDSDALLDASHRFLAASRAAIALVQMDDITDESTPVNVPTTRDEHPNWRRRLSHTLEAIDALPRFAQISRIFAGRKR